MKARVIKIISNQYTLVHEDQSIIEAFCTGKMRLKEQLLVGDFVEVEYREEKYGIIDILPRVNVLKRPFMANVDQAYIMMSLEDPKFSYELVNRMVLLIEYAKVKPIIVISKCDLAQDADEYLTIGEYYKKMGYETYFSFKDHVEDGLIASLKDRVSVFCGQSGVGKSSILNNIDSSLSLKTNVISKALGRGKHTTRHVELFEMHDGLVADTPGFSSLNLYGIEVMTLQSRISAFKPYNQCYYRDCKHINEPDCGIKKAVEDNLIQASFYKTYVDMVAMIESGNYNAYSHRRLK